MLHYIKMSNVFIQAFIFFFSLAVVLGSDPRDFGCFGFRESKECLLFKPFFPRMLRVGLATKEMHRNEKRRQKS
ncbi:hypothetical protein Bca4012_045356 [Brassica carinata]